VIEVNERTTIGLEHALDGEEYETADDEIYALCIGTPGARMMVYGTLRELEDLLRDGTKLVVDRQLAVQRKMEAEERERAENGDVVYVTSMSGGRTVAQRTIERKSKRAFDEAIRLIRGADSEP
jgi:hypothetical protein